MTQNEHEIDIVANAIGFALYKNTREVMMLNGVESVEISAVESQNLRILAAEAIKALDCYRETMLKTRKSKKKEGK